MPTKLRFGLVCLLGLFCGASLAKTEPLILPSKPIDWYANGQQTLKTLTKQPAFNKKAKNIILFVGDGMGISTITAARIFAGQLEDRSGEENFLSFEKFPYAALIKTYNTDQQVPDSAGTMSAIMTGEKTRAGVLSIKSKVKRGDHLGASKYPLKTLFEMAEEWGLMTGVVTTTRLTHATPAASFAHSPDRNWEDDSYLPTKAAEAGFKDIAQQFVDFNYGDGIDIALGGGRRHFLPQSEQGKRKDGQNLITKWQEKYPKGKYIATKAELTQDNLADSTHVFGLFNLSHLQYESQREAKNPDEPSLTQMTTAAIDFLESKGRNYILVVESGRIDHAHHDGNAFNALRETVEFAEAIQMAKNKVDLAETLMIVTADHSHVFTMGGYPVRGNDILGKSIQWDKENNPYVALDKNGLPYTTLAYANGPGYRGKRPNLSGIDTSQANFIQEAAVPLSYESHAGEDVAAYAIGPQAHLMRGVIDQHVLFHIMKHALNR